MTNLPVKYQETVNKLKEKIRQARTKSVYTVNAQLLSVYWEIGKTILGQQAAEGWGAKVIDRLSQDLRAEFPDMKGLSVRNIKYMRAFAGAYPNFIQSVEVPLNEPNGKAVEFVQAPLAQIFVKSKSQNVQVNLAQLSWYHHITLLDKVKNSDIRLFYIQKTIENGWSRDVMVHQIEGELHKRQGNISSNFQQTIAPPNSELVKQVFKDPYKFDFIYLGKEATERDLEDALTNQLKNFLLELGQWFAFMGRQYKITLGGNEYFFDLLFYHTRLKRYIVIDLKIDEFKPEYKGKMEFYLNLADEQLKNHDDEPSIGLILCKTKNGLVAEYALRNSRKPIGIAEYRISDKLPKDIKGELPTVEELEAEMEREIQKFQRPMDKKLDKLKELLSTLKYDEVKEKLTSENTAAIFNDVVLPLKNNIWELVKSEILNLFESASFIIWTDSQGHSSEIEAANYLSEKLKNHCYTFKIQLQLKGFKKAGIKTFDIWKSIIVQLGNYSFTSQLEEVAGVLIEKLYHQLPDKSELAYLAEKYFESLIDDINQRIEQINHRDFL
jgi:predicted nuclease of restriction endonuclease-like (RecB) superfamily